MVLKIAVGCIFIFCSCQQIGITNGDTITIDNIFTKVPYNGNSISVWHLDGTYYMMPLLHIKRDSIGYVNSSFPETIDLEFEIILMSKTARLTVLKHLRRLTDECVNEEQIQMVPTKMTSISINSKRGSLQLGKSWDISLMSNPDVLIVKFNCQDMITCRVYKMVMENVPRIQVNFNVTGTLFQIEPRVLDIRDVEDQTDIKLEKCKTEIELNVAKLARDVSELLEIEKRKFQNEAETCLLAPYGKSGIYRDKITGKRLFCDMVSHKGGWTVIIRRYNGFVNFTRSWLDYKTGFGDLNHEFWIGNEEIHRLTQRRNFTMRIDAWDRNNRYMYGMFQNFKIGPESMKYQLNYTEYSGNITRFNRNYHRGRLFSTYDNDNDSNWKYSCSRIQKGGWWFGSCGSLCLTCEYKDGLFNYDAETVHFKKAVMMIR